MTKNKLLYTSVGGGLLLIVLVSVIFTSDEEPTSKPVKDIVTVVNPAPVPAKVPLAVPPPVTAKVEQESKLENAPDPDLPVVVLEEQSPSTVPNPSALPGLNESDKFVREQINDMANAKAILGQLTSAQIIRKFVVLVDGMSRGDIPSRDLPVIRSRNDISVSEVSAEFYRLDPVSYDRFNLLVNTFVAINSKQIVDKFEYMSPLYDTAYAELGYPNRSFDNAVREAIDNILNAQIPEGEILLIRPSVNYRFADPSLENLTDLEKLFIRMGPENTAKVQRKVREIRALLTD